MAVYYVDFLDGNDAFDGLSPNSARRDHSLIDVKAGDCILFKRNTVCRGYLHTVSGEEGFPISYGAYGEGEKPIFCASVDLSDRDAWEQTEIENVWRCKREIDGDVGNFLLDGECTATLRWDVSDLRGQGDFYDSRFADGEQRRRQFSVQELLFYSGVNPADAYKSIECISYANRVLGTLRSNIIIEDICFMNSGVHALAGAGKNVTVRRCDFKNIGGCAWNSDLRIRFGNAVEFWNYAENVLVENCTFKNVYDSCVTHQGEPPELLPAMNFVCKNNRFDTYGMAALELRDIVAKGLYFTENECENAGCGFAMLGETLPRRSEIWPLPMGHHVFIWRMTEETNGGCVHITDNEFFDAPEGAAIYSIVSQSAEKQFYIDRNRYLGSYKLIARYNGEDFFDFDSYSNSTENDKSSRCK